MIPMWVRARRPVSSTSSKQWTRSLAHCPVVVLPGPPRGCPSGAGDAALLAPADQSAVEAHQPDLPGQPGGDRVEQRLLEADRAASTRQASGNARSPQRRASITTWWRSDILD